MDIVAALGLALLLVGCALRSTPTPTATAVPLLDTLKATAMPPATPATTPDRKPATATPAAIRSRSPATATVTLIAEAAPSRRLTADKVSALHISGAKGWVLPLTLNVRQGRGTEHPIIGKLRGGETIELRGRTEPPTRL